MRQHFRVSSLVAIVAALSCSHARGDEGLWTYDKFPSDKVMALYGFAPDARWLERLRLGSVSLDTGCSAGLVSGQGLVQTNHHCVEDCVLGLSAKGFDPNLDPMIATTLAKERICSGLHADILVSISDVTARIAGAMASAVDRKSAARDVEISRIEEGCRVESAARYCEVVMLYGGGIYALYEYKRYSDVRLVFAPEAAAGTFGGDPDNFNFPRYAFDVAFLRLYENGSPANTPEHLKWRSEPLTDGELVFVSGHPGDTGRLWPMSMISYLRDVYLPWTLVTDAELRGRLQMFASRGPEQARTSHALIYDIENSYKSDWGELTALSTPEFFGRLQSGEVEFRRTRRRRSHAVGGGGRSLDGDCRSV